MNKSDSKFLPPKKKALDMVRSDDRPLKIINAFENRSAALLKLTNYKYVTTYNNYYEFGTGKSHPFERSQKFKTKPWNVVIDGEVETPITLSIIGCVVNGPGEAAMTDIGITGGGKGNNMLYLSGIQNEKVLTKDIIDKVVSEVEKKASEFKS